MKWLLLKDYKKVLKFQTSDFKTYKKVYAM